MENVTLVSVFYFLLLSIRGLSFFSLLQPLLLRQLRVNQLLSNRKKPWVAVQVLHLYHKTIASFRYWVSGGKLEWFSAVQSFVHFWLSVYSIEKVKWDLWTFFCVLNTLFISLGSSTNFHGDLGLIKLVFQALQWFNSVAIIMWFKFLFFIIESAKNDTDVKPKLSG